MKYEYCRRELKLVAEERQTMIAEFKRIVWRLECCEDIDAANSFECFTGSRRRAEEEPQASRKRWWYWGFLADIRYHAIAIDGAREQAEVVLVWNLGAQGKRMKEGASGDEERRRRHVWPQQSLPGIG